MDDPAYLIQRGDGARGTVGISPFVRHDDDMVGHFSVDGVVVCLIQQPGLGSADFRGDGGGQGIAHRFEQSGCFAQKSVVSLPVAGVDEFEIDIQTIVILALQRLNDIVQQGVLHRLIVQDGTAEFAAETAAFFDIGDDHHRGDSSGSGGLN